jgi:hypothetical protein
MSSTGGLKQAEGGAEAAIAGGTSQYPKSFDGFANKNPKIGALKLVDRQQCKILP